MQITFDGRPLVATEVGRLVDFDDLDEDWAALGHTCHIRIWNNDDDPEDSSDYSMSAIADPNAARLTTTAAMFPTGRGYQCKIVTKLAGVDQLLSETFTLDVMP